MQRCLDLAVLGRSTVAPNPMVGAVLVYNDRIIGEGYHQQYGKPHAEVNCLGSVLGADRSFISSASLYVSLEPCSYFGKTPPCTDLIIKEKIPTVVIGCSDPNIKVNGRGIAQLQQAGIKVITDVLEKQCSTLNKRFYTFHRKRRPYVILKWAQTKDGKLSNAGSSRLYITNEITNRFVHKWRSEEAGIVVGTNTALNDDPSLTTRFWTGPSPVRIVVDMDLKLPGSLKIFDGQSPTLIFNTIKHDKSGNLTWWQVKRDLKLIPQIMKALFELQIQSIIVEGGAQLLQSFIDEEVWDEARVITSTKLIAIDGLPAPTLRNYYKQNEMHVIEDNVVTFLPQFQNS